MACWRILRADGQSELRYIADDGGVQPCGSIPSCAEDELLAWVGEQAQPYDSIVTPAGQFFRQHHACA